MRERRGVITAVVAGIVGVAVLVALALLVLVPRLTPALDVAAPAPRWAPPAASPPVAAALQPSGSAGAGIATLVDAKWAAATSAATGIPERAVLAYAGAALTK